VSANDDELLDRTLAATRRGRETTVATAVVAVTGGLFLLQAAQLLTFVTHYFGLYRYAPAGLVVVGASFLGLASKIYSQRVWAVVTATVLAGAAALALGLWYWVVTREAVLAPLTSILPFAAGVAAACAATAIGPCKRTDAARKLAAEKGLDLDL
jgi:hypothetical protein